MLCSNIHVDAPAVSFHENDWQYHFSGEGGVSGQLLCFDDHWSLESVSVGGRDVEVDGVAMIIPPESHPGSNEAIRLISLQLTQLLHDIAVLDAAERHVLGEPTCWYSDGTLADRLSLIGCTLAGGGSRC